MEKLRNTEIIHRKDAAMYSERWYNCISLSTLKYNWFSSQKSSYIQILGRHGATCVTSDQCGNMFISCQDEIFIARPAGNEYHSILSTTDDIKNPFSIDIDIKSHELFVLNNGGKSVYVFQKHMEDVWCNSFNAQFEIVRFNRSWTVMYMLVWGTCFDFVPIRFWNCSDSVVFPILFDIQVYTSNCH